MFDSFNLNLLNICIMTHGSMKTFLTFFASKLSHFLIFFNTNLPKLHAYRYKKQEKYC